MEDFKWLENFSVDKEKLALVAEAQRYYILGHVSLLVGIYCNFKEIKVQYKFANENLASFLSKLTFIAFLLSIGVSVVPGFGQLKKQFDDLSFMSGTFALCYAIVTKNGKFVLFSSIFYLYNFSLNLVSGFKEPIIISLLLLGIFLFPYYKRLVLIMVLPFIYIAFFLLPAYVGAFRQATVASSGETANTEDIRDLAIQKALEEENSNWDFLTSRLSEISMFVKYISSTPKVIPYYGLTTVAQSIEVLVPRVLWPGKPITESMVMERVYKAGIADERSTVSAKPMYIVDGYLAFGVFGIFVSMFLYGLIVQSISQIAEKWFGGYLLGTAIIFNGLFSIFWRGLSFEFIVNAVFYGFLTMFVIRKVLERQGILVKI